MRWIFVTAALALMGAGIFTIDASAAPAALHTSRTAAAGSGQTVKPLIHKLVPAPPHVVGCYRYAAAGWRRITCATQAFIKKHFPHPEVLSGISGKSVVRDGVRKTAAPFTVGVVGAQPVAQQAGSETDTQSGSGAYSIQDNVFFKGSNGKSDGVQFTDQTVPFLGVPLNGVCVWQIVIPTQNYNSNCAGVLTGNHIELVEGTYEAGFLTVAAAAPGTGTAIAVIVPDMYGLGGGHRWNNNSGSILGMGNGSEALFSKTEELIELEVSDCLNDAGFVGYSVFCESGKLKPLAYVSYSPGPSTKNFKTLETNNLVPVLGNPPAKLPKPLTYFYSGNTAQVNYAATTTGHCWTGKLPYCY